MPFAVSHRIAGLVFRTESNTRLLGLHEAPFARFYAEEDAAANVLHRIHKIAADAPTLSPPPQAERQRLARRALVEPGAFDCALLRVPLVREWIDAHLDDPNSALSLHQNVVLGRDFARQRLDLFYLEESAPAPPDDAVESRSTAGSAPTPHFRIHALPPNATSAPLPGEERERFTQGIGFSSPEIADHPLLRAPLVRRWLHASLDRRDQIEISVFMDGVLVWNLPQNALDFFYQPEFGTIHDGRVMSYLRRVFSTFLPAFSALLVHSSGVIRANRAALFLAEDGGGKTTVIRHAAGAPILNDDQIILRQEGNAFVAHATPLGRFTSGPCQARLGACFVLEKATRFELTPIAPADLLGYLWHEHRIYTEILPRALKLRAFDLCRAICREVPAYLMRFPADCVDWRAIDAAMGA